MRVQCVHVLCTYAVHICRANMPCTYAVHICRAHMPCTYAVHIYICRAKAAMRSYRDATREAAPPPHSFAVAERMYRTLLEASSGAAQSVVVSGKSGAG